MCGAAVDCYGDHGLSCRHLQTHRTPWHNLVEDVAAGMARHVEPAMLGTMCRMILVALVPPQQSTHPTTALTSPSSMALVAARGRRGIDRLVLAIVIGVLKLRTSRREL